MKSCIHMERLFGSCRHWLAPDLLPCKIVWHWKGLPPPFSLFILLREGPPPCKRPHYSGSRNLSSMTPEKLPSFIDVAPCRRAWSQWTSIMFHTRPFFFFHSSLCLYCSLCLESYLGFRPHRINPSLPPETFLITRGKGRFPLSMFLYLDAFQS